jgi:mono/diheme cytochrome c family protein
VGRGDILFHSATIGCNACHGADGKTPTSASFPSLKSAATNASVESMAGYIILGKGTMPAYQEYLYDQEVADIVAWVKATVK